MLKMNDESGTKVTENAPGDGNLALAQAAIADAPEYIPKHIETFARAHVIDDLPLADCYLAAFPEKSKRCTRESLRSMAYNYKRRLDVQARIRELEVEVAASFQLSIPEIIKQYHEMANADPADIYDENGHILPIHKMPRALRRTLTKIKHDVGVRETKNADGETVTEPVTYISEFALESRLGALNKLVDLASLGHGVRAEPNTQQAVENKQQTARRLMAKLNEAITASETPQGDSSKDHAN